MTVKAEYFPFDGGLDLVTPTLSIPPGRLLGCQNYEINPVRGYSRIDGYERFNGKAKPSDASYWILNFDSGSSEVTSGTTVTGGSSSAAGVAVADSVLSSGSYAGGDAAGYMILYGVSGTFTNNEPLLVSAVDIATADGVAIQRGASTDTLDTTYYRAAIEATRTDISAVPGTGQIRGVWVHNNIVYAFRNQESPVYCAMYKSTTAGWVECDLGHTLFFDAGSVEFTVDTVLTGASSGASGTIKKVVVQDGSGGDGDAEGYLVLYSISEDPFEDDEIITDASSGAAVANGASAANQFTISGSFKFVNYNFLGHTYSRKMYGCNGIDRAFEWDGSTFAWIYTGMSSDAPININAHVNYLFLFFTGGSIQHSSIGDPLSWSVITGAGEIGTGDEITGSMVVPGLVLAVFCRNSKYILEGSSPQDFFLRTHSPNSGAIANTIQMLQQPIYLDDMGLTMLENVQDFGDLKDNTFSDLVQPRFDTKKDVVTASVSVRSKNQYIIYFSDNSAIVCTFRNRKVAGFMDLDYGRVVRCIVSGEDSNGDEQIFFGSDDGYIYQLNKGTSFDGSAVGAFLRTAYNHFKTPRQYKRFHKIFLEMAASTDPNMDIEFAPDLSYSDPDIPSSVAVDNTIAGGGGYWNSANWNNFYWSGQVVGTLEGYIDGAGINMSLLINSEVIYERPHTIHGAIIHYSIKGPRR